MLSLLLALPPLVSGGAAEDRPNVLLIMSDQHNPRYLGCAGHPWVRTPHLDRLAAEGARFTAAYSNAPVCSPARAATFFGRYPTELGLLANGFHLETDDRHLAELLAEAGYATGLSGKSHILPVERGRKTFQWSYLLGSGVIAAGTDHSPYARHLKRLFIAEPELFPGGRWRSFREDGHNDYYLSDLDNLRGTSKIPAEHYGAGMVTTRALRFVEEALARDEPFFLFASYFIPHHPYYPPLPYAELYDPDELELPPNFDAPPARGPGTKPEFTEREWREILAHYGGLVTLLDDQVGRLIAGLESHGVLDDTLVIFVADHGDMMGEFRAIFKGQLADGSARVPLILRFGDAIGRGLVVDEPVEQVDLFSTVLDAAGVDAPPATRGRSLLPLARGETDGWKEHVFCASQGVSGNLTMMVRDERHKLVLHGTRWREEHLRARLFDMREDPWELDDRAGRPELAETQARLDGALRAWWAEQRALEPAATTEKLELAKAAGRKKPEPTPEVADWLSLTHGVSGKQVERFVAYRERRTRMLGRIEEARESGDDEWARMKGRRATIRDDLERMTRVWLFDLHAAVESASAEGRLDEVLPELGRSSFPVVRVWVETGEPDDVYVELERSEAARSILAAFDDASERAAFLAAVQARLAATPGVSADEARARREDWSRLLDWTDPPEER